MLLYDLHTLGRTRGCLQQWQALLAPVQHLHLTLQQSRLLPLNDTLHCM